MGIMSASLLKEVTVAMEAPQSLLPYLPFLLQDLPSLSGVETDVVSLLQDVGLQRGGTVLDLGCGRGEIDIALARALGAEITGVDAFAPFIAEAREAAAQAGVAESCTFYVGDMRRELRAQAQENRTGEGRYDAIMMIAVGPVFGDAGATIGALRVVVRPGGWIVIGDAYLQDGVAPSPAWTAYTSLGATEAGLTRFGDTIVRRRFRSPAAAAFNARALKTISARAAELAERHPAMKPLLDAYVARQFEEVAEMEGPVVPALWVIQRANEES
jgi:cyclopropane fatty-acyl-phospholipid synthase-like methyltransferase